MRARPDETDGAYTFGDSAIASERMAIVARAFAPTTRALLESVAGPVTRLLDLGPGPGYSTELLAGVFPAAEIVAVEQSEAFAAETRARVPSATVVVGDVTAPLPGAGEPGFDLVYARFLLSHLPDIAATVDHWCRSVAPGGVLVLEEPEQITARDPLFARYEAIVTRVVAGAGADMYAGAALAAMDVPAGFRALRSVAVDPRIPAGVAAAMFWRNAQAWDASVDVIVSPEARAELVDALRARVDDPSLDAVSWRHRQLVLQRVAVPAR